MKRQVKISILSSVCLATFVALKTPPSIWAQEANGASISRVSFSQTINQVWYLPPYAEFTIVDPSEKVYLSILDNGSGKIITAIQIPDTNWSNYAAFYSDHTGLSSRIPIDFSQSGIGTLMPPTIYSIPNINGENGSLGFIGNEYPNANITLEIDGLNNEKKEYNSLANSTGEWQIILPKLSPGSYQAKAYAESQGMRSTWSQEVKIMVLNSADQFIQDLGSGTRQSLENVINGLPTPVKGAAQAVDKQSEFGSKFLLPTLLTLSALAQSGILAQSLLYILFQAFLGVAQLLGLTKKRQPMGVVYDAITKRPLGRVIVRLYESGTNRLVETDVTTALGVFSFMPTEGYYYLRVMKPGYLFPSQIILAKRDGRYTPIYSGNEIHITQEQAVINVAVPMDPEAYQETFQMKLGRFWQKWFEPVNRWLLVLGFFLALLAYSRQSTRLNFVILWCYVGGLGYVWYQGKRFQREYGVVINNQGKPLAGIELVLMDNEYNRLVSRRVTDERGHYQFVAPPGKYQIKVETPEYELVNKVHGAYQGNEVLVEGERGQSKHIIPKIVVKESKK